MRHYKLLTGLLLILFLISCKRDDNIIPQQIYKYERFSSSLEARVNCVYFIDTKTGFAAGSGKIFKTVDGGVNWQSDSITNLPINSIYFVNNDIGFAVGGIIYKTINGGDSWTKVTLPYKFLLLNSVFFINKNIGFAIGLAHHLKTINGGKTWEQFVFDYKGLMEKISFVDSQTGFAAGLFGNIFKTTDQGKTWIRTENQSDGHIYDFYFVNKKTGYAGGQKKIVKTVDGGDTWNILPNSPEEIYFIHFADVNKGIAIGKGHYTGGDWGIWTNAIYSTSNGGKTWEKEDNINFGSVASFPTNNIGYSIVKDSTYKIIIQ